jgi:hypothetical protein
MPVAAAARAQSGLGNINGLPNVTDSGKQGTQQSFVSCVLVQEGASLVSSFLWHIFSSSGRILFGWHIGFGRKIGSCAINRFLILFLSRLNIFYIIS